MSMIQVNRKNYPERTDRNGKMIPAEYTCSYRYEGKEIAKYYSREDILYLRSDYILCDFSKSHFERATTGEYAEAYKYLFGMLGVDETSNMSEYTYM